MKTRQLAVCLLVLLMSGCVSMGISRDSVRVTVSDIQIVEATLLEQLYRVTLRVQNRTDRPISVNGGSFDLEINGRDFASGVSDQAVTIAAFGDQQIDVRMVSTVFGVVRLVQGFQSREGEPLAYSISGSLSTGGFGGVWFEESGEIDLLHKGSPVPRVQEGV
jgi:LEA14-like dessication related protein